MVIVAPAIAGPTLLAFQAAGYTGRRVDAGDDGLRRQLRHGRPAADRALKTADGSKFLPIWIGHAEAAAILMKLQGSAPVRPLTHDLLTSILGELEAEVVRITVTELRDSTFYARITLRQNGQELEIDSRPSDAIAIAVRAEAKIFATDEVIEESAIEFEGDDEDNERRIAARLRARRPRSRRSFATSSTRSRPRTSRQPRARTSPRPAIS